MPLSKTVRFLVAECSKESRVIPLGEAIPRCQGRATLYIVHLDEEGFIHEIVSQHLENGECRGQSRTRHDGEDVTIKGVTFTTGKSITRVRTNGTPGIDALLAALNS